MNSILKTLSASIVAIAGLAGTAWAEEPTVIVEGAWSRASIGMNRPGAAYMTIRNLGAETETLVGIRTDLAMMPEIHLSATNEQGVSTMTPMGDIEIAPDEAVALEPGGLHVMLMRLSRPMIERETFALTLVFADGDEAKVEVPILGIAARGPTN